MVIEKWLETRYTSKIEPKVLFDGLQMGERKKSRMTLMFCPEQIEGHSQGLLS